MIDEYDLLSAVDDRWRAPVSILQRVKGQKIEWDRFPHCVETLRKLAERGSIEMQRNELFVRENGGKTLSIEFFRKRQ